MTSRPSTSKPRGICKYYDKGNRGCLAGNSCKFLHGEEEKLTPFDKAKTCRFYAAGFCKLGEDCWYRHVIPDPRSLPADEHPPPPTGDVCGICLEEPVTFGLLSHCTHAFCLGCVKQWRDQKNNQDDPDGEAHRANKRCPFCRTLSSLVIPSSHYYPEGHPGKAAAMKRYKDSTSRVPCKHFDASPSHDRYCPFGRDCLYKHENADGTPYVFNLGVDFYMPQLAARRRHTNPSHHAGALENPLRENLNLFFRDVRAVLGEYFNAAQDASPVHDVGSEVATPAAAEHLLDVLANELSAVQLWESDDYEDSRAGSPLMSDAVASPPSRNGAPRGSVPEVSSSARGSQPSMPMPERFDLRRLWRRNPETVSNADSMPSLEDVSDSSDDDLDVDTGYLSPEDSPAHQDNTTNDLRVDASFSSVADDPVGGSVPAEDPTAPTASTATFTPTAHAQASTSTEIRDADRPRVNAPAFNMLASGGVASTAPPPDEAPVITSPVAGLAAPPSSPSPEALPEPPFMTDGRGRVVWSRAGTKRGLPDATSTPATSPAHTPPTSVDRSGPSTGPSIPHASTTP